ncbi:hypothetical protein LSH36_3g01083 [Paralvinella palmiformis]|uniref:Ig-like domain-containing protein n=1 Tax=Paralvinella palmiformis TaxID=53620 RepID=A0AAD9NHI6_9ANNE|nr:hypothetical protein LSH36_3g01083 [Paralvinella palmiformis]
MNLLYLWIFCVLLGLMSHGIEGRKSFWVKTIDQDSSYPYTIFPNTMYKGGSVTVQVVCSSKKPNSKINVQWILEELDCLEEMFRTAHAETLTGDILTKLTYNMLMETDHLEVPPDRVIRESSNSNLTEEAGGKVIKFMISSPQTYNCFENNIISLKAETDAPYFIGYHNSYLDKVCDYLTYQKIVYMVEERNIH